MPPTQEDGYGTDERGSGRVHNAYKVQPQYLFRRTLNCQTTAWFPDWTCFVATRFREIKVDSIGGYTWEYLMKYYETNDIRFVWTDWYTRYGGVPSAGIEPPGQDGIVPIDSTRLEAIYSYDRAIFPAERAFFLSVWLGAAGHIARAAMEGGRITGYGVIRPCYGGARRVGPLFADDPRTAQRLLHALMSNSEQGDPVFIDVPEPNTAATELCQQYGLEPTGRTRQGFIGLVPSTRVEKIFGVTTLEVG